MVRDRLVPALGFVALALVVTWPLPLHLATRLPGTPTGDTGVYVWNLWIFRHELLRHAQWPFLTDHIFALTNGTELSVHNYTVFADLLALPLIGRLGVVATFNLVYLFLVASSGYAAFLLARRLLLGRAEAWIAGAAFAASPFLIARGTAHFSLVAAAPLPIFLVCLLNALRTRHRRDAVMVGVVMGWAGYCDVYYTIHCLLMGLVVVAHHQWQVASTGGIHLRQRAVRTVDVMLAVAGAVVVFRLWYGESSATLFGQAISIHTLYTPVLAITVLGIARLLLVRRFRVSPRAGSLPWALLAGRVTLAMTACAIVLSPIIVGLAGRIIDGRFPNTPINWRSSPPGMDLVDLLVPNPNHPWFGGPGMRWIETGGPLAFPEFVGSLSLVILAVTGFVIWRIRQSVPRLWIGFTVTFVLLALGPFVQVARVNTYIPGPWMILRYVPVIGLARSPARFAVVAALGLSVVFGYALAALRQRWPTHWRVVMPAICVLLTIELLPAPRPLYDASVPAVYSVVAENLDESWRLLDLPGGVRDGTSSIGDFNASAQFFQTVHRKPLVGGYQSRVSEWRKQAEMEVPVLAALFKLSERGEVPVDLAARAHATGVQFVRRACLGYVVIDRRRASTGLRSFAIDVLDLVKIADDEGRELFVPAQTRGVVTCGGQQLVRR